MSYTREQLEAMQGAGVPVELDVKGDGSVWTLPESRPVHWHFCRDDLSDYRPQPGYTFGGDVARKLMAVGVEIECQCPDGADGWERWNGQAERCHEPTCHRLLVFRIADTQPEQPKEREVYVVALRTCAPTFDTEEAAEKHAKHIAGRDNCKHLVCRVLSAWQRTEPTVERVEI